MKKTNEIDQEINHVEYAKTLFVDRLAVLTAERDAHRQDTYAEAKQTKQLATFFKAHGLFIVGLHTDTRTKQHYQIAKQIWRAKDVLVPFIRSIADRKRASLVHATADISADDVTSIKNLCDVLAAKEWLSYKKVEDGFEVTPTLTGLQSQFLRSGWSEEITLYLLDKALKSFTASRRLKYKLFWDVKLKRVDPPTHHNVDMQLDLIAEVGDRFYVFETKSGPVLAIEKWVDRTRLFEDKKHRFITCTANEDLDPRIFDPFRLFALPTLESQFKTMLEEDFPVEHSDQTVQ